MIRTIQTNELKVGMYVILPGPWFSHGFFKSEFKLVDTKDIDQIVRQGIKTVQIDIRKSDQQSLTSLSEPSEETTPLALVRRQSSLRRSWSA